MRHSSDSDRAEIGHPPFVHIDCCYPHARQGVQQRPQESASPAANIQQALRINTAKDSEHSLNSRELDVCLEFVETQPGASPVFERRGSVFEASANEGAGEFIVVAVHGQSHHSLDRPVTLTMHDPRIDWSGDGTGHPSGVMHPKTIATIMKQPGLK